jgi:mutator protein MutT
MEELTSGAREGEGASGRRGASGSAPHPLSHSPAPSPIPIAIAVVEHDGKFLIGKRPEGVALAGLWEFPGGKVEPGETAQQAAARECLEETGIEIEVGPAYPAVVHQYDHARVKLEFFACRVKDSRRQPHPRFIWAPTANLAHYEFPAANKALIAFLTKHV